MDLRSMEFAHDLKTPIQLICSCVQMIELELEPGARAGKYLRMLRQSTDQLQSMVLRALQPGMEDASCDAVRCAERTAERFALLCAQKGIAFAFRRNTDSLNLRADPEKIERILQNLLANAVRFTPRGGSVEMELRALNDTVEIRVADTGCGIPAEMLDRVFETGVSRDSTGLGLPIARALARSMDGDVTLRSETGSGSVFTLRLPVKGY